MFFARPYFKGEGKAPLLVSRVALNINFRPSLHNNIKQHEVHRMTICYGVTNAVNDML